MPRSSPYPYLSITWSNKQISILSGKCARGFQSCPPLAAALFFRTWGVLHVVLQENMCHVTLDHGGVQRGTCAKRVTSLYVLQRSRSLQLSTPGHSSAPSVSHKSSWLGKYQQLHQLCLSLLQADLLSHCRYHGSFLLTFSTS